MKTHCTKINNWQSTRIHRMDFKSSKSITRLRVIRKAKKRARFILRKEMDDMLDETIDEQHESADRYASDTEELMEDIAAMDFMREAEIARKEYEDEMIARWSQDDYPSSSGNTMVRAFNATAMEHMDEEDYEDFVLRINSWD